MIFVFGAIAGAVCTLAIIGLHRVITYDRYKEGLMDGILLHDTKIIEFERREDNENA